MSKAADILSMAAHNGLNRKFVQQAIASAGGDIVGIGWKKNKAGVVETFVGKLPDASMLKITCFVPFSGKMSIRGNVIVPK